MMGVAAGCWLRGFTGLLLVCHTLFLLSFFGFGYASQLSTLQKAIEASTFWICLVSAIVVGASTLSTLDRVSSQRLSSITGR